MRSAMTFLVVLLLVLLAFSTYVQVVIIGKLPFEPSTLIDIIAQAALPSLVAAAIVLPWRLMQSRRGKISSMPMWVALAVVVLWQYQTYTALKESIGQ
jgi:hypothetical protein